MLDIVSDDDDMKASVPPFMPDRSEQRLASREIGSQKSIRGLFKQISQISNLELLAHTFFSPLHRLRNDKIRKAQGSRLSLLAFFSSSMYNKVHFDKYAQKCVVVSTMIL